jgi:hypothetical protein
VNASRREWRLVAAGVVGTLLVLVVVGRLQGRNLHTDSREPGSGQGPFRNSC